MEKGELLYHTGCPKCGSKDNVGVFQKPDGRIDSYCFGCKDYHILENKEEKYVTTNETSKKREVDIEGLISCAIPQRQLDAEVAKFFGVKVEFDEATGAPSVVYFPLYKDNNIIGWKARSLEIKQFWAVGETRGSELFGQNKVNANGKFLIITEGEFDALATRQLLAQKDKKYNVVSIPNGAGNALRAIKNNLGFVESFDQVVLVFDQDEPGKKAALEVAEFLTPGKAKIASFSEKDPNDMLFKNKGNEFLSAVFNAKEYRPDGILRLSQTWDELWRQDNTVSIPYPWEGLNKKVYGARPGEIVVIGSGSGLGKSSIMRELQYHLFKNTNDNIGILALEENIGRTNWGLLSIEANIPLHIREERKERGVTEEQVKGWWDSTVGTGRFIAYDHWGSTSEENLLNKIRYMVKGMDCKWIFLDHISIVVSDSGEIAENERIAIDTIMTRCRSLVEETGAGMFIVTHLKRPQGKGHEKGAEVELAHFRGSGSIAHLADISIAGERNQQEEDEKLQNLTKIRVLKNRYAGHTGVATHLFYSRETGRLSEVKDVDAFIYGGDEENEF